MSWALGVAWDSKRSVDPYAEGVNEGVKKKGRWSVCAGVRKYEAKNFRIWALVESWPVVKRKIDLGRLFHEETKRKAETSLSEEGRKGLLRIVKGSYWTTSHEWEIKNKEGIDRKAILGRCLTIKRLVRKRQNDTWGPAIEPKRKSCFYFWPHGKIWKRTKRDHEARNHHNF